MKRSSFTDIIDDRIIAVPGYGMEPTYSQVGTCTHTPAQYSELTETAPCRRMITLTSRYLSLVGVPHSPKPHAQKWHRTQCVRVGPT